MKILIHSNAPFTATAYGQQTALIAPRFAAAGHDVAISCMTGVHGKSMEWQGLPLLPMGTTAYSADIIARHAEHFFGKGPGLLLIHYDPWAITPEAVQGLATACWAPVHSRPMSVANRQFFQMTGAHPIAVARYGVEQMEAAGLAPSYVPHGVDLSVFRPMDEQGRAQAREALGVPQDSFIAAVVAANKGSDPPRKGWGEMFAAFKSFHARHPQSLLFVHSPAADIAGIDMRPLLADLKIGGAVIFSDDYAITAGMYTPAYVAAVEGMADVLLATSWGEGFGIPVVEAQACGTPVIVADSSAMPELLGAGWKVPTQGYWHPGDRAWWHPPSIAGIESALEKAWTASRNKPQRAKLAKRARAFAERYDVDAVFTQHWKPVLEMLEQYAGAVRVRPPGRNHGSVPLPTAEADGLTWLARGSHTDDWIAVGHEDALSPVLDGLMPEGGVLVDVGAHVGRWALRLAGKASRVVAVEPNPDTAAVLRYHIALNKITNVAVIEVAAWDEPGRLVLDDPNHQVTGGSTRALPAEQASEIRPEVDSVEALPLDAVLEDEDRIDLIKLDVEGADLRALAGMAATLAKHGPVLFIEDHSIYGYYGHSELIGTLAALHYHAEPFTAFLAGGRSAPYVIARPAQAHGE